MLGGNTQIFVRSEIQHESTMFPHSFLRGCYIIYINPSVCLRPSPNVFFRDLDEFCRPGDASPAKDGRAAEVVHAGSENWHLLWLVLTGTMAFYDFPYIGNNDPN